MKKQRSNNKISIITKIIVVLTLVFTLAMTLSACRFKVDEPNDDNNNSNGSTIVNPSESDTVDSLTKIDFNETFSGKVQQWSETLGYVERNIPTETKNEGLSTRYPTYGTSIPNITDEEKDALLSETSLLFASDTTYDSMDSAGNYYLNGVATGKTLYKHTSSVGMYYGDVADDEKAVIERITVTANEVRNYITGIYAPAGEVIKIEISDEDLQKIGGKLTVIVGQVSHRNNVNNIWKARNDFSRMPIVANQMTVTSTVAYVGNPLGGPVYIYPSAFGETFSVTISGGVKYAHYIHGQTTAEDVEEMKNYSAPYYDYEVWDLGVRHSGPKLYGSYDYDNLVKCGDLWEKIIRTSRQVPCSANATIGVGYVYDCFVAAGAACAFQGGHSWVNAPCSWLGGALNYESMVTNGFWGVIHEYNHLYQSYGMEGSKTNEVTNNATSLLSYVLYTKISEKRSLNDSTLTDWNRFTDPSRSLRETLSNSISGNPQNSLNAYADLIHTFGTDIFTAATRAQKNGYTVDAWYEALSSVTDYNFTYYFEDILNQTVSDEMKALYDTDDRILFVPVATVFQTGRSFYVDGKEVFSETVRPYLIERGESITMDFNERLIIPTDYSFKIKNITMPENGTLEKIDENIYKYTPDENEYSGNIQLTIELVGDRKTEDVTINIQFRQYYKNQVEITKYTYGGEVKYATVEDALNNNFEGYTAKNTYKNTSTFVNGLANGQIGIVEGKIYIEESANYAICLRSGRGNNTLYLAINDTNYYQALSLDTDHGGFALEGEHVVNLKLNEGDYLYFKEITLSRHYADAFSELGIANLDASNPTMKTVPTASLCTTDMVIQKESLVTDEKYPREYNSTKQINSSNSKNHTLVDANMPSWSESEGVENIFDGDPNTYYHNNRNNFLSEKNPFILIADMGKADYFNSITITTRTTGQYNLPVSFELLGSLDNENWFSVGKFTDLSLTGNTVTANFDDKEFRYYKLIVTKTKAQSSTNQYVTIASIDFTYALTGKELSPYVADYYVRENESFIEQTSISEYGKLITGNGTIRYSFTGTGIAIQVRQSESAKVKVIIDSVVKEYVLDENSNPYIPIYFTGLNDIQHDISIEVIEGKIYMDSVLIVE